MKLNTLLLINALVALAGALGFIFAPAQMLAFHLGPLDITSLWLARELGGAVIGYALLCWFARSITDSTARRVIVIALFSSWAVGFVVALLRQLSGAANTNGWGAVVIYFLFALGYGYVLFLKPALMTR